MELHEIIGNIHIIQKWGEGEDEFQKPKRHLRNYAIPSMENDNCNPMQPS